MTAILQVLVSPRTHAWSRRFAGEVVSALAVLYPGCRLVTHDLAADPPPHPDRALYDAILSPAPADDPRFALSERYIAEVEAADLIVIGTPVNNFTVPSTLKAWIDHIVRIHRTFRLTQQGKFGLLRDRPLLIASAHGGYVTIPLQQPDFLAPYLQPIFETIGIRSIEFVRLEGMNRGLEAVARALDTGRAWIGQRLPQIVGPCQPRQLLAPGPDASIRHSASLDRCANVAPGH